MACFFAVFLLFAIFILYNFIYSNSVFPNIYLGGRNLGGLTASAAYGQIAEKSADFLNSEVVFQINGEQRSATIADLGLSFDYEGTTRNLYKLGRSGNILEDSYFRLKSLIKKTNVQPVYVIYFSQFAAKFDQMFAKYNQSAKDASLEFKNGSAQIIAESAGQKVDRDKLISDLRVDLENLKAEPIVVNLITSKPKVEKKSLTKLKEKVDALTGQTIILSFNQDSWRLSGENLFEMLKFYPAGYEDTNLLNLDLGENKLKIESAIFATSSPSTLTIHLENQKLDSYISDIGSAVDRPAKDANLKFENGKVSEFTPAQDGQSLNRELLVRKLGAALSVDNEVFDKQISIALPVAVTRAKIANDEINSLGIRELVGRGVSYFAHSIPNRAWNVGLGTSRVSGTLVKPGEIFSFNNAVGEVSGGTGYRQAYVISAGKTVLDDGGGICQVSTTVFRAALNAGLPIVSRTAHAYRVGYYEQNDTKPGFDATVFAPSVDFQFKNDTANSLLVQAVIDQNLAKLEVDIYGTRDGRRVEMSDSVVSNQTPALPDKREDDPTLPVGQVKQVDFAAAGATAFFTRKVYRGNDLIIDDAFKSVYRPWAAVYLVGTKS